MKRMSIIKKVILFVCVVLVIMGMYGGGYFVFNYAASPKAANNSEKVNPKPVTAVSSAADKKTDDAKKVDQANLNQQAKQNEEANQKNDPNGYDIEKASEISNSKYVSDGKKVAFLTFDDGPSVSVTPKILSTLDSYGIKATFFLVGKEIEMDQASKDLVNQIFKDGHAIGNHTYSHEYRIHHPGSLYYGNQVNVDLYMQEVDKTNQLIGQAIGKPFKTKITRMPGGEMSRAYYHDPNLPAFDQKLKENNMASIDWNGYDGDAEGGWKSADRLFQEAINSIGDQEKVVILMHDTYGKEETAKMLPRLIEYLKQRGYEFKK